MNVETKVRDNVLVVWAIYVLTGMGDNLPIARIAMLHFQRIRVCTFVVRDYHGGFGVIATFEVIPW